MPNPAYLRSKVQTPKRIERCLADSQGKHFDMGENMMKTKFWQIVLAILVLILGLATVNPVFAQEETYEEIVYCDNQSDRSCEILSARTIEFLKDKSNRWDYFLSYGENNYSIRGIWYTKPFDPIPSEIHIAKDSYTSLPQMGIFWWKDHLVYYQSGWLRGNNTPLTNPGDPIILKTEDINDDTWFVSYSWNGSAIMTWNVGVSLDDFDLVIHINQFMMQTLTPTGKLPPYTEYSYDYPADNNWIPGEELEVLGVYTNTRTVPDVYLTNWEDLDWYFEDQIAELRAQGVTESDIWSTIKSRYQNDEEVLEMLKPWYNYKNTMWKVSRTWVDNYLIGWHGGFVYRYAEDNIMTSRACSEEEHCYSTSFTPKVGQILFVYPYTLEDIQSWKEYENGDHVDLSNLWLFDVYPGRKILARDQELLDRKISMGEVSRLVATITGWNEDGKIQTDKGLLNLSVSVMPPIGTQITAWIYNEDAEAKYYSRGELTGKVMALFDDQGLIWFFNNDAEYGFSFDAEIYSTGHCGGLMNIDLWVNGCDE